MIEQIKQLRVEIDGLTQLCEGLKPITEYRLEMVDIPIPEHPMYMGHVETLPKEVNTEEIKEAVKSLKLSKAWLGKVLESLGSENPYGSGYKTVEDIVPETDKASLSGGLNSATQDGLNNGHFKLCNVLAEELFKNKSHIEKVDWLRTEIKCKIESEYISSMTYQPANRLEAIARTNAYNNLCEARFWLGFEMSRIRNESR